MALLESLKVLRPEQTIHLLNLAERAVTASNLGEFASHTVPGLSALMESDDALLYVVDPRLLEPFLYQCGSSAEQCKPEELKRFCSECLDRILLSSGRDPIELSGPDVTSMGVNRLYPLRHEKRRAPGMLGLAPKIPPSPDMANIFNRILGIVTCAVSRLIENEKAERQLRHLNTYMTVSAMLAQPLGLNELLEYILCACLDAASAEEASVLLLDDEKRNFQFYQLGGPSKPLLIGATFPADKGIAGSILKSQQSEIINEVQSDPRFYGKIDSDSGVLTKNMIVLPLTAGEERIGVLEVLNKIGGELFTTEEHKLLLSIADEIAYAIRNAKLFEYVVNSYCKQRQGLNSCKGCQRPLGSWTPCVKYREEAGVCDCVEDAKRAIASGRVRVSVRGD